MDRLTVCETDRLHYAVRPDSWAGIWNKKGQIKESLNHLGLFLRKEDAENFKKWKIANEQGRLMELPCVVVDTVWSVEKEERKICKCTVKSIEVSSYSFALIEKDIMFGERMGHIRVSFGNFGRTVFPKKEEAESTLQKLTGEPS